MAHTLDVSRLEQVFDGLEVVPEKLTARELDFVTSLRAQWESGKQLSEKQLEWLEAIWQKV